MNLLKKENWWMWLLLFVITGGSAFIFLGYLLGCFDKKAWYNKPKNWIMGLVILVLPFIVMMSIFTIEMTCKSAKKLDVSNSEIYLSPVILLLMLCIPIIGWVIFIATIISLSDNSKSRFSLILFVSFFFISRAADFVYVKTRSSSM